MLKFLEDYEAEFMNIDYVTSHNPLLDGNGAPTTGYCTDAGKRDQFMQNFTLSEVNEELIETVESTTETWPEMVDALRQRIAK